MRLLRFLLLSLALSACSISHAQVEQRQCAAMRDGTCVQWVATGKQESSLGFLGWSPAQVAQQLSQCDSYNPSASGSELCQRLTAVRSLCQGGRQGERALAMCARMGLHVFKYTPLMRSLALHSADLLKCSGLFSALPNLKVDEALVARKRLADLHELSTVASRSLSEAKALAELELKAYASVERVGAVHDHISTMQSIQAAADAIASNKAETLLTMLTVLGTGSTPSQHACADSALNFLNGSDKLDCDGAKLTKEIHTINRLKDYLSSTDTISCLAASNAVLSVYKSGR